MPDCGSGINDHAHLQAVHVRTPQWWARKKVLSRMNPPLLPTARRCVAESLLSGGTWHWSRRWSA